MNDLYLIFVPEICSDTFVLLNIQSHSFSTREYRGGKPKVKFTSDYPGYTGLKILRMAQVAPNHCIRQPNPPRVTGNDGYWNRAIRDANSKYLKRVS